MELDFRHISDQQRESLLLRMMQILENELPENMQASQIEIYPAIGQFFEALLIHLRISPGVFGMLLHDAIICSCKEWYIPASMFLGIADRLLDPAAQFLMKFGKFGKYKAYNATLGIIDSMRDQLAEKKFPGNWQFSYLSDIAVHLAPYGDKRVPGLEDEGYKIPDNISLPAKPPFIFVFHLDDDGNLILKEHLFEKA